jgi:hypothetical protein
MEDTASSQATASSQRKCNGGADLERERAQVRVYSTSAVRRLLHPRTVSTLLERRLLQKEKQGAAAAGFAYTLDEAKVIAQAHTGGAS